MMLIKVVAGATAVVIFVSGLAIVNEISLTRAADLRNSQIEGCERGNAVRAVVFRNTSNAIKENHGNPKIARVFRQNLQLLVAPEEVNDKTGLVNCEAAIE